MHEFSIAQSMLQIAADQAARHNATRVTKISCRIGVLRHVVPSMLQSAFEIVAAETPAAGAALEIEKQPVTVRCRECETADPSFDWRCNCPSCGSSDVEITGGSELLITRIELETKHDDSKDSDAPQRVWS